MHAQLGEGAVFAFAQRVAGAPSHTRATPNARPRRAHNLLRKDTRVVREAFRVRGALVKESSALDIAEHCLDHHFSLREESEHAVLHCRVPARWVGVRSSEGGAVSTRATKYASG